MAPWSQWISRWRLSAILGFLGSLVPTFAHVGALVLFLEFVGALASVSASCGALACQRASSNCSCSSLH